MNISKNNLQHLITIINDYFDIIQLTIFKLIINLYKKGIIEFELRRLNIKLDYSEINYSKSSPLLEMTFLYQLNDFFLLLFNVPFPKSSRST